MITVVLTTFGRSQELLEEAVQSFLLQSYPDKKLLIVNIHPTPVIFDHPEVEVHNIEPFEYYGQQAHYALSQIETPLWCILDSDDIMLPWHLEQLYENYSHHARHPFQVGCKNMWYSYNNRLQGLTCTNWCCYLYDSLNKDQLAILEIGSKCWYFDQFFYKQDFFKTHRKIKTRPGYISRRELDWQMEDLEPGDDCSKLVKKMPGYSGSLKPHWRMNYAQTVKEFLSPMD